MRGKLLLGVATVLFAVAKWCTTMGNRAMLRHAKLCGCELCTAVIGVHASIVRARQARPEVRAN